MQFCFPPSSQSSIHLQTSPDKARKHPPHKLLFCSLQFRDITYSPVQIHYIQAGVNTLPTDEHPKQPAYTCRLLLISPESTPPHKTIFFETFNWNWWLQAYPKISLQIFKHPGEVNKSACNWETPEAKHQPVQIPYIQTSSDTLRTGWYKDITYRLAPKAAYTDRLLLINPESTPPHKTIFFENLNWNCWLQAYPKISLQIFKHAAEDRPKPEVFNHRQLAYAIRQCWNQARSA